MPTLHWIGKNKVINHHQIVPFRVLEHQYGFSAENGQQPAATHSGNMIIYGDNLEALKALLPQYEGKVKCIYIDPPYNTGNESWVYNDNVNDPRLKKWLGQVVGKESEDLSRHDKWLCMMYPRLKLLHKLLANDGAIFISIDDNEQAHLRLLCDEIFGVGNFVANITWQKIFAPKGSARHFSANHDFILVYARNANIWYRNLLPRTELQDNRYKNLDNDPRGIWASDNLTARNYYSLGTYSITTPSGRVITGPPKGTYWRVSKETFDELNADKRIWWGKDGKNTPRLKRFLSDVQQGIVPQTIWFHNEVGNTQEAKKEIVKHLSDVAEVFTTPKPTRLIQRILQIATNPGDLVLDSFAGSGTTAHAVLNQNKEDGGNRRFILIEMEEYAESITAERVKRVIQGYGQGNSVTAGLNGSFDYYGLGQPLFIGDNQEFLNEELDTAIIRQYVFYSETQTPMAAVLPPEESQYYLGRHNGASYYFMYEKEQLTTLNYEFLSTIKNKAEQYIIYADNCLLSKEFMKEHNLVFKKIPRDITRF